MKLLQSDEFVNEIWSAQIVFLNYLQNKSIFVDKLSILFSKFLINGDVKSLNDLYSDGTYLTSNFRPQMRRNF